MFWKAINRPECNQASASLLFMDSGGFIHPDYHQPMNVILQGLGSCDVDVWRVLIAGMAWAMTSANSFTVGPARRDRIRLQKFLWAQQWSAINKLTGFSTLDSTPTRIIAEQQHTVCVRMIVFGWLRGGLAMKALWWTELLWCDLQNMHMFQSPGATKVYFPEEIMMQRK